jgi:ferredoxin
MIFAEELKALEQRHPRHYDLHPIYTREVGEERSHERHFTPEQLEELCPDWREREVWACGPQALLDDAEAFFEDQGRGQHFHVERFRAAMADLEDVEGGEVTFQVDGATTTVEADGETPLLRVAENAGLNPAHGCRMGNCHSCDSPLVAGRVRDLRSGRIIDEAGHKVQTCISAAAGPSTIDLALQSD